MILSHSIFTIYAHTHRIVYTVYRRCPYSVYYYQNTVTESESTKTTTTILYSRTYVQCRVSRRADASVVSIVILQASRQANTHAHNQRWLAKGGKMHTCDATKRDDSIFVGDGIHSSRNMYNKVLVTICVRTANVFLIIPFTSVLVSTPSSVGHTSSSSYALDSFLQHPCVLTQKRTQFDYVCTFFRFLFKFKISTYCMGMCWKYRNLSVYVFRFNIFFSLLLYPFL